MGGDQSVVGGLWVVVWMVDGFVCSLSITGGVVGVFVPFVQFCLSSVVVADTFDLSPSSIPTPPLCTQNLPKKSQPFQSLSNPQSPFLTLPKKSLSCTSSLSFVKPQNRRPSSVVSFRPSSLCERTNISSTHSLNAGTARFDPVAWEVRGTAWVVRARRRGRREMG